MGELTTAPARVPVWLLAVLLAATGALVTMPVAGASTTGSVVGTVTASDGTPAAGVTVEVRHEEWTGPVSAQVTTGGDGTYTVTDVAPGRYLFRFVDPSGDHLWTLHRGDSAWPDKPWLAALTTVEAGATVQIDHTLVRSGSVRGRLTLPDDVDPAEVSVVAWHPRPSMGMAPRVPAQWARVAADGSFVLPLKAGEYAVEISHPDDLIRLSDHVVTVHGTEVTTLDVTPRRSGSVSGVVTVPDGHEGVDVRIEALVQEPDGRWRSFDAAATTRVGEPYRLSGLDTGHYRLRFTPADWRSTLAASHWPAAPQVREAQDVFVVDGEDTPGKDGALVVGGVVEGRVDPSMGIDPGSTQVELRVDVSEALAGPPVWDQGVASVDFGEDGSYRLVGVPQGRYRLAVVGLGDTMEVFHPGVRTIEAAAEVAVTHGEVTSGVDVTRPAAEPTRPTPLPEAKVIRMRKAPKVSGKPRVGRTLKATRGRWNPGGVTVKLQWQVKKGKKAAPAFKGKKATRATLELTKKLRGKRVRVRVMVRRKGHVPYVFTSKWSKKVA